MSQAEEGREPRNEGTSLTHLFQALEGLENPRNQMSSCGAHPWAYTPAFLLTPISFSFTVSPGLGNGNGQGAGAVPGTGAQPGEALWFVKHAWVGVQSLKVSLLPQALEKD